jgi:SAM-dependent methyltransferase
VPGTRFEVRDIGQPGALNELSEQSFDYVFIQDTLLFYFIPIGHSDSQNLTVLLSDLFRVLKPGGLLISIEPHPTYYLAPWLGNKTMPFTIVTEHRQRRFSTVPTAAEFTNAILKGGLKLERMEDLYPETKTSTREIGFAHEFPLWTLMEFAKPKP